MKDQLEALVGKMVESGILFPEAVNEFEKKFIKRVLDRVKGNQSRAARALGIHRNTLEPENRSRISWTDIRATAAAFADSQNVLAESRNSAARKKSVSELFRRR